MLTCLVSCIIPALPALSVILPQLSIINYNDAYTCSYLEALIYFVLGRQLNFIRSDTYCTNALPCGSIVKEEIELSNLIRLIELPKTTAYLDIRASALNQFCSEVPAPNSVNEIRRFLMINQDKYHLNFRYPVFFIRVGIYFVGDARTLRKITHLDTVGAHHDIFLICVLNCHNTISYWFKCFVCPF